MWIQISRMSGVVVKAEVVIRGGLELEYVFT